MEEVWKDVVGYEGKYKVNNRGNIINRRGREVRPEVSQRGYLRVRLCCNNKKTNYKVHRIVAQAFIPNPNFLPQIDHINGNKQDNRIENLRWVDNITNNNSYKEPTISRQPVAVVNGEGVILMCFHSIREASRRVGVSRHGIMAACKGIQKTAGGHKWIFYGD